MAHFNRKSTGSISKHVLGPIVAKSAYQSLFGDVEQIERNRSEIYIPGVDNISTATAIGNTWNPQSLKQGYKLGQYTAKCYNIEAKYEYNIMDEDNYRYNLGDRMSLADLQQHLLDLAIAQRLRSMALHGTEANTGLVSEATTANLSANWSTIQPGVLLQELINHVSDAQAAVKNAGTKIMVCGSIKLINRLRSALVNTDKYLKSGSTGTVASSLEDVLEASFHKQVEIVYDETLVAANGDLQLLIVFPNMDFDTKDPVNGVGDTLGGFSTVGTWMGVSAAYDRVNPEISGVKSGFSQVTASNGVVVRKGAAIIISKAL